MLCVRITLRDGFHTPSSVVRLVTLNAPPGFCARKTEHAGVPWSSIIEEQRFSESDQE
jgi:hypothetical protein